MPLTILFSEHQFTAAVYHEPAGTSVNGVLPTLSEFGEPAMRHRTVTSSARVMAASGSKLISLLPRSRLF